MKRVLALLICVASSASAQPAEPRTAEQHYEASKALYNIEKYDEAIAELKQAYELARDPIYLFNIAQAMRKKTDCAGALDYYRKYLRDSPDAQNKAKVEQWMVEMEACAKTQPKLIDQKPVDIVPVEPTPVPRPINPTPKPPPPPRRSRLRVGGLAIGAVGGGFVIAGTALAISANRISNGIEKRCQTACDWTDEGKLDTKARNRATYSLVAFGVGGAALIGGSVMFMLGRSHRELPVAIVPTTDGAMVTFARRY